MTEFSVADKRAELVRELGFRQSVYPKLVAAGKLPQHKADRQRQVLEAILADYADAGQWPGPNLRYDDGQPTRRFALQSRTQIHWLTRKELEQLRQHIAAALAADERHQEGRL